MPPRLVPKKLPTKTSARKTLEYKNPTEPASQTLNNPKSNSSTVTKIESAENSTRAETALSSRAVGARSAKIEHRVVAVETRGWEDEDREGEEVEADEIRKAQVQANERRKQKEYEVFVGRLDRDAVEEDLEKVFKEVGDIVEVRLVKKPHSQQNKGFAFVRFATVDQAKKAAELRFPKVKGRVCEVTRNNDNETLHLRNICTAWTQDELVEKLKAYDLENLEGVHLIDDPNIKGKNRGYAFLSFSSHMDAVTARNKLQEREIFFGTDARAEVAFAKSAVEPDEEFMSQVRSIFLDRLPATWEEDNVRNHFKKFGEIEKVELARYMPTAKRNDFGFITFRTREAALACISEVNKGSIGEGKEKLVMKATLRKPLRPKRILPITGSRRLGYVGKSYGERELRPHGIGHSYSSRPSRTHELMARDHSARYSSCDYYSTRGDDFRSASPLVDKYEAQLRKESARRVPAPAIADRRTRDLYVESSSSSSRHALREYREFSDSYPRYSSRELYDEYSYGPQIEYYEDYDYPVSSGSKRSYTALDDEDLVVYSSRTSRARRDSDLDIDAYAHRSPSAYEEYAWVSPDRHFDYDKTEYVRESHRSRYTSGSGSSRLYY